MKADLKQRLSELEERLSALESVPRFIPVKAAGFDFTARIAELEAAAKKHNAQLTAATDRAEAAEKALKFWQDKCLEAEEAARNHKRALDLLKSIRANDVQEWHEMEKDAELGRLVRAMPVNGIIGQIYKNGVYNPQWRAYANNKEFVSDTPEEALRSAGVSVEEKSQMVEMWSCPICQRENLCDAANCIQCFTRRGDHIIEQIGFETRRHVENIEGMASDDGLKLPQNGREVCR